MTSPDTVVPVNLSSCKHSTLHPFPWPPSFVPAPRSLNPLVDPRKRYGNCIYGPQYNLIKWPILRERHRSSESISFILSTDESYEKSVTTNHFNIFQNRRYHRHRQLLHKEDIDLGHSIRIQSALFRSPSLLSSLPLGNEHQLEMIATACLMWKERRSAVEIALFKKDEPGSNSPFK